MNTLQINDFIQNDIVCKRFFLGVFSRDELPIIKNYPCAFIINTDKSSEPGEHWLAFFYRVTLTQNIFSSGKYFRTLSLNSHYLILFKNPRDKTQIEYLARQINPSNWRFLLEAFQDAVENKSFSYLFIDLKQATLEKNRIQTGVIPGEERIIYTVK